MKIKKKKFHQKHFLLILHDEILESLVELSKLFDHRLSLAEVAVKVFLKIAVRLMADKLYYLIQLF